MCTKTPRPLSLTLLLLALAGCTSTPNPDPKERMTDEAVGPGRDLVAAYSLLYSVVADEAKVDGIFLIRSAGDKTKAVVNDIARTAQQAKGDLEAMGVRLDAAGLPDAEVAARDIIAGWQQRKLMFGGDFERNLLLTQAEATQYMAALAQRIGETERDPERLATMKKFAGDMEALHARVIARLKPEG